MIFEVFKSTNNLWYFHLKANNNEIIAVSEGYHHKYDVSALHVKFFREWEWRERDGDTDTDTEKNVGEGNREETSETEIEGTSGINH